MPVQALLMLLNSAEKKIHIDAHPKRVNQAGQKLLQLAAAASCCYCCCSNKLLLLLLQQQATSYPTNNPYRSTWQAGIVLNSRQPNSPHTMHTAASMSRLARVTRETW
jgi:hypothetical protein